MNSTSSNNTYNSAKKGIKTALGTVESTGNFLGRIFNLRNFVWFGLASTFLFYNTTSFSYWSLVAQKKLIDWNALWQVDIVSLVPLAWISLGAAMVFAATWLFFNALKTFNKFFDIIAVVAVIILAEVLILSLGLKNLILSDWKNATFMVFVAMMVVNGYAMWAKRAELKVYKHRDVTTKSNEITGDSDSSSLDHNHDDEHHQN